jgi:hypothetical protein
MKRKEKRASENVTAPSVLRKHFGDLPLEKIVTAARTFPVTARVDLQSALERVFAGRSSAIPIGVHTQYSHETLTFTHLTRDGDHAVLVGPLQYDEVDTGGDLPCRCLNKAVWLLKEGKMPFVVLLTPAERFGRSQGVHLEVAVPAGNAGLTFTRAFLDRLEKLVHESSSYRGKVISLEALDDFTGRISGVKVHRLRGVQRDDVILPEKTLLLLERNITEFLQQRESLRRLGMATKKGLLFYGPPGTGKTHTIHYLAGQLPNHTTLLITAEQVALLDDYFQLARFLQPAMVVIEDVDLIAREREHMHSACQESLLNKLLNEMDGLREDADLLFVLTTNRPEHLETALASRPGRVDQAIEFPLPDEDGRRKLVHLYARGLVVPDDLLEVLVRKTNKASAAFIKELMRRSAQYHLRNGSDGALSLAEVESALDEMLFSGGTMNLKLLGRSADDNPAMTFHN